MVGTSQLAAPISSAGVVLSQPTSSTTPSIGLPRIASSTSMLARLRNSIAVGRRFDLAVREHRELDREAAGLADAALDVLGELAEVRVAGRELGPGVADADDRPAVEQVGREALVLHPAAVHEAVAVRMPNQAVLRSGFLLPSAMFLAPHAYCRPRLGRSASPTPERFQLPSRSTGRLGQILTIGWAPHI